MKISSISASVHSVPVQFPLLTRPLIRRLVFVRVDTDEGLTGFGMTGQILPWSVREFINQEIAPVVVGQDPLMTEKIWHDLFWRFNPRANSGAVQSGISAVDIALWDVKGKYLNQPVWKLLGGYTATPPAYVTFGVLDYDRDQLVEVARQMVAAGHDKLKMVVGLDKGQNVREDAARVRAVREAIGPDIELMVDANQLFSPVDALELCKLIEPYDIRWFEEPVWDNNAGQLAQLRTKTRIPIGAGQNEGHRWRQHELFTRGAVDIAQTNVLWVGGYTEGVRVAHLAQAFDLVLANGAGWPHHNAHLIAAVANGWRVEYHYEMWKVGDTIFQDPPAPINGRVTLTEEPGLGLLPREDALQETLQT